MKKKHQQQQQQKSYQCMRTIQSINLDRNLSKRINNNKNKGLISFYLSTYANVSIERIIYNWS